MGIPVLHNMDLHKNEIQNVKMQILATAPQSPAEGQFYYNSTDHMAYQYNGTAWVLFGAVQSVNNKTGVVTLTKSDIDLGNVDNTSDATKKTNFTGSIADGNTGFVTGDEAYDALALKADKTELPSATSTSPKMDGTAAVGTETTWAKGDHVHPTDTSRLAASLKGVANGVAELDSSGKVPSSQLPSFVDDVIEAYYYNNKMWEEAAHTTEITPETGKIYVDLSSEKTYRWGGSAYVEISASLALGETSTTAYRGDHGKEAHDLASAALPKSGGTMTGDIAMGSHSITGLAAPVNDADAATKKYVDDAVAGGVHSATGTIGTNATSASVSYSGTLVNAYAKQGNDIVLCDISATSSAVTFSVSAAPDSAITCVVIYS